MLPNEKVRTSEKEKERLSLVVFAPEFVVAFRMLADWAFLWHGLPFEYIATVSTFPFCGRVSFEDVSLLDIG